MHSKLEARLLNYFLLIAFAAVLIGIEFYFEMDSALGQKICNNPEITVSDQNGVNPLDGLRNKIFIMFLLLSFVVAIVLTMFIKNIAMPLCNMALVAKQINEGDLSQTVMIESHDEIGEVGIAINELASNLQEVASYTSVTASESLESIRKLQGLVADDPEIAKTIHEIEQNLVSMRGFVDSFKLLDTELSNV